MRFNVSFLPIGEDTLDAEESEDSGEDDESESLTNFRVTHQYSDSKSHSPASWCMHDGVKGECGKMHAKLHKHLNATLPSEAEDAREALQSLAIMRKYALKAEDKQVESEIWLSLQSRYVEILLSPCV